MKITGKSKKKKKKKVVSLIETTGTYRIIIIGKLRTDIREASRYPRQRTGTRNAVRHSSQSL